MSTEGPPGDEEQPKPLTRAEARAMRALRLDPAAPGLAQEPAAPEVPVAPAPVDGVGAVPEDPSRSPGDEENPAGVDADADPADPQTHRVWSPRLGPAAPVPAEHDAASARATTAGGAADGTDAPRASRRGRFVLGLAAVVAVLAVVSAGLAVFGLTQGPRVSSVQLDPEQAIAFSGSRVILTANQPLEAIDPSQVTVTPEIPFTVDAAGRNVGVRFTVPLDDATEYTVTVADVVGIGGGPTSDLSTSFTTPPSEVFLLLRAEDDDRIFRTGLAGEQAVAVFAHPRINDFRETASHLVVVVEEDEASKVLVVDKSGGEARELPLPGDGSVTGVQVSDRGGLVGFVYSDRDLSEESGRANVLVTMPLSGEGEPSIVEVAGEPVSIDQWQFVYDTASVVFISFEGTLFVSDRATQSDPSPMGTALSIQGVERGTYTAVIQLTDGALVRQDLADGSAEPFPASDPDYGVPVAVVPFPGGTTQHIIARDGDGMPTGQAIVRVDDDGTATPILEVGESDTILQACPSPSGQYVGISVAPDLVNNPFDDMLLPLPERVETHILDLRAGELMVPLAGVNISWCAFGAERW